MMEVEKNPNSKEAQEYYKNLSELERNNPRKKTKHASIIIKNMRGGKTLSTENIAVNEDGTPKSQDELDYDRKYLDFAKVTFPEVNPIEMLLPDHKGNGQVRLQTYRYPCADGV